MVIFFGNDFIPQQQLRKNFALDRELYIKINRAVEEFNKDHDHQINIENECPANDNCFIRPVGIDVALKAMKDECPIPVSTFYNLNAPGITFTYKGGELYRACEHVEMSIFTDMLSFVHNLMIEIGPDDSSSFEKKTEDDAMSALKIDKIIKKNNEDEDKVESPSDNKDDDAEKETDKSENSEKSVEKI